MCGLTHEDWMIMRSVLEDRSEPHRALVLSGMTSGHEVDIDAVKYMRRWAEAELSPAERVSDSMEYEVRGYSQPEHLIHPGMRRNGHVEVRRYRASDRMWIYAEGHYEGLNSHV